MKDLLFINCESKFSQNKSTNLNFTQYVKSSLLSLTKGRNKAIAYDG
ncbi:MAG: hypothetical protein AAF208_13645 [Cyanobacteria bacterium P01_A01_bin.45]